MTKCKGPNVQEIRAKAQSFQELRRYLRDGRENPGTPVIVEPVAVPVPGATIDAEQALHAAAAIRRPKHKTEEIDVGDTFGLVKLLEDASFLFLLVILPECEKGASAMTDFLTVFQTLEFFFSGDSRLAFLETSLVRVKASMSLSTNEVTRQMTVLAPLLRNWVNCRPASCGFSMIFF